MIFDPPGWDRLDDIAEPDDPSQVLAAASADLISLREKIDESVGEAALPFRVQAVNVNGADDPHLIVRVGHRDIPLTDTVLLRAHRRGVGPLDVLSSAIWSPEQLNGGWRPRRVGRATPPTADLMALHRRIFKRTIAADQVESALENGRDVLVVGAHGSGRSALVSIIANRLDVRPQRGVVWLNLTDPADGPESIIAALLQADRRESYLVVVEGLQANLPILDALFQCIARLRGEEFGLKVHMVATGWRAVADLIQTDRDLVRVTVDPRITIGQMLSEDVLLPKDRQAIRKLTADDVHLARHAIDFYVREKRVVPTEQRLQSLFVKAGASDAERLALYQLACMGVFGLVLAEKEADRFGAGVVAGLFREGLAHRVDGAYTIAPRRRAWLVLHYALDNWDDVVGRTDQPEAIVWQHLQEGGERLIRATLSQMDHVVSPDLLRPESLYLLAAWEQSERLGAWLELRTRKDPTWKNNLGAAVFAAIALTRLNRDDDLWLSIAAPIREKWLCADPAQEKLVYNGEGEHTADFADFVAIAEEMRLEDLALAPEGHPSGIPWDRFDKDRAYLNWVLGLLLCLEGMAPAQHRDETRIARLLVLAERAAAPDGSFYPARAPWVTARIIQGLYHADVAPQDSAVVAKACRWLLGLVTDPRLATWWRGGTGTWNRDKATTAMCITALTLAGYRDREAVDTAIDWLLARQDEWLVADQEIDLALIIEALATSTDESFDSHLRDLLTRTVGELDTQPAARPEEGLRLPFLAAQLAQIVRETVHNEFLRLLRDVMKRQVEEHEPVIEPVLDPTAGAVPESSVATPATETTPCGLEERQLRRWEEAAAQLVQTLNNQINRRIGVGTAAVGERLNEKVAQLDRANLLRERLDRLAPHAVLRELDTLGSEVCGPTWPRRLPYPDRYCDDDAP